METLTPFLIFGIVAVGMYLLLTTFFSDRPAGRSGLEGLRAHDTLHVATPTERANTVRERLAVATRGLRRYDVYRSTDLALLRAGWSLRPVEFGIAALAAALAGGGIVYLLTLKPLGAAAATALIFALTPTALKMASMHRMSRFEAQLPDALELMAASLRAGHGFQRALQVTAQDMPRPICDEFNIAVQDIGAGRTVEEALQGILQRIPSYEMELIATAVGIQMNVGGNLSEILTKIADTLRERARIKGEIATLTAEGRLSAWILFLAPVVMLFFMVQRSPEYMAPLLHEQMGHYMLAGAGILQVIGMIVIWRMLAMEV